MKPSLVLLFVLVAAVAFADGAADCRALGGAITQEGFASGCLVKKRREGVWRALGPGGQLIEETTWKAGKKNGPSVTYFAGALITCQIKARGGWLNGQRHGPWAEWTIEGKRASEGTYEKGVRVGTWTTFHPRSGEKHLVGPYVSGLPHGTFQEHLLTGEAWREVQFENGERVSDEATACRARKGVWSVQVEEPAEGCTVDRQRSGQWRTWDGHGKLRSIANYQKGVLNGRFEEFHPTGEPLRIGMYLDGLPDGPHEFRAPDGALYGRSVVRNATGEWRAWHPTGKLGVQGRYERGCPEGEWRVWSPEGHLVVVDHYAQCRRNGLYTDYHEGGAPRRSGQFVDGAEDGPWEQRWQNGKVEWLGQYVKGSREGTFKLFRWDGSPYRAGPYVDDVQQGNWQYFFPTGKPEAKGEYLAGDQTGDWQFLWPTGKPWRDVAYEMGRELSDDASTCGDFAGKWSPDVEKGTLGCLVCRVKPDDTVFWVGAGRWTFWHPDGRLEKRGQLVEGKPTGHWEYFHDTGTVMLEGDFDGGVEEGDWRGFYRDGTARFIGGYLEGKPTGEWTSYHPDGGLLSVGRYQAGQKVGTWKYLTRATPEEVSYPPDGGR